MVGSAVCRRLGHGHAQSGSYSVLTASRSQLNLLDQASVDQWFAQTKPELVVIAAARVGGIHANNAYPADFIYENIQIQSNIIYSAWKHDVERLVFLGSSCIYPKFAAQPITESALLGGELEATNEPYAIAKISGIKMCESFNRQYGTDFRSLMPTNLYGPGDNFHPLESHVFAALLARFEEARRLGAREVEVWGTGRPRREFMHVDDLADAIVHVLGLPREVYETAVEPMQSHLNVGTGKDVSIAELADLFAKATGYSGVVRFDATRPDGTPRKLLDVSAMKALGWGAKISLQEGIDSTLKWYRDHREAIRS